MRKLLIFVLFLSISVSGLFSENILGSPSELLLLEGFKIYSSDYSPGSLIDEAYSGWETWNGADFTDSEAKPGRMITLKTDFTLDKSVSRITSYNVCYTKLLRRTNILSQR